MEVGFQVYLLSLLIITLESMKMEQVNTFKKVYGKVFGVVVCTLSMLITVPVYAQNCPAEAGKLINQNGGGNNLFGYAASVSGDTAIIGAFADNTNGPSSGAAYVFVRSEDVWVQQAKLLAPDGANSDNFGVAVSISGDSAIVGAYRDDDNGDMSGSAYVFVRSGGVWSLQAKLVASDGLARDVFGYSVSLNSDIALIGAPGGDANEPDSGAAYVFTRSSGIWTQQAKVFQLDGATGDGFGGSVSISMNTAVIGSRWDDDNGDASGSAYVFTLSEGLWSQQAKLIPTDGVEGAEFGNPVSLDGDTAVIGASYDDDNGGWSGSAYVYARNGESWALQAKLLPDDGRGGDRFGRSVSVRGDIAVIGSPWSDHLANRSGSAYLFTRNNDSEWIQGPTLLAGDGMGADRFGSAVAFGGSVGDEFVVVGASGSNDHSAYSFYISSPPCMADLNGNCFVDFFDISTFIAAFIASDPSADFNDDGMFNFFDINIFLTAFKSGCP